MGRKKAGKKARKKAALAGTLLTSPPKTLPKTLPKTRCCVSRDRCRRCPIRMLKDGTLPEGYTVKKRELVRLDGRKVTRKKLAKAA